MSHWSTAARQELERYFARLGPWLRATGADPGEVIEDLRQHLRREVEAEGLTTVTEADVRRLLAKIGAPEPEPDPAQTKGRSEPSAPAARADGEPAQSGGGGPRRGPGWVVWFFGVLLPVIALAVELTTGMCAAIFFDPLPTWMHAGLVALVPVANGWLWHSARRGRWTHPRLAGWLSAVAVGVAAYYTILYLPLMVPGFFAVLWFGWGLLPWSPCLALWSALWLRRWLPRPAAGQPRMPRLWAGALAGGALLIALGLPEWVSRVGLDMATSSEPSARQRGVALLRALGHHETLLRACYGRTRGAAAMDVVGWILTGNRWVSPEEAREVYYRVYGQPFNAVPAPPVRTARGGLDGLDEWTWDPDQGGDTVGGRIRNLDLVGSRLDVVADARAAWSYTEWTLEFENRGARQREARAVVLLPPGGVVSRLTLWVDGEEREAAFAGRARTRAAYQRVVQRRRDPVLVSTAGPDRVLVQCFPVPPGGGRMMIRLGITAPLVLRSAGEGLYVWPRFAERNFNIPVSIRHTVWLEAAGCEGIRCSLLAAERLKEAVQAVRGRLTEGELADGQARVLLQRDPGATLAWTPAPPGRPTGVIVQRIETHARAPVERLALVVDVSAGMEEAVAELARLLPGVPETVELAVFLAGEPPVRLGAERGRHAADRTALARALRKVRPRGGEDNLPALEAAWDWASEGRKRAAVFWIHGPLPVRLGSVEPLRQRVERRRDGPSVVSFVTRLGPDAVTAELEGVPGLMAWPRVGTLSEDLEAALASWVSGRPALECVRQRAPMDDTLPASARTGRHLGRLWAREEVERLRAAGRIREARELAVEWQLVTPVSGAVVLENERQYQEAGLQPVDPETVPAIPEPGTRVLWLIGLGWLLWGRSRQRAARRRRG